MNILRFIYLASVGLLIYQFMDFSYFKSMYENENGVQASTLTQVITSTINFKLWAPKWKGNRRFIGEISQPQDDPTNYWSRYFFDISFFIIFNMLNFQMLFEKCFICGISKDDADKNEQKGWHFHINIKHNLYNMLFYMISRNNKVESGRKVNLLELYIHKCMKDQNPCFFPIIDSDLKQQLEESAIRQKVL